MNNRKSGWYWVRCLGETWEIGYYDFDNNALSFCGFPGIFQIGDYIFASTEPLEAPNANG